ncbi:MAG: Probable transmembrane protein [uncultured Paraburkholderia sp.]|nr:MAG: Probable transmembrane protein [uncultured Paraburkholderia sp.]CAH2808512.1 MAG: Probable transmembrane protein [uncultured Paraburkholderia sp.]CAH2943632.1 MAG: Probable transmembrane protein [uncultured Paraburkholderia sp.]CAH2944334.1 MAG: Probable transmembrane protein [uncultured Paraburkholderia sp.]
MPQPVDGVFTLSSELAYDAASKSVVLKSPNVDNVSVSGARRPTRNRSTRRPPCWRRSC